MAGSPVTACHFAQHGARAQDTKMTPGFDSLRSKPAVSTTSGTTTGFWYNGYGTVSVPGSTHPGPMEETCEFETKERFICYIPNHTGRYARDGVQLLLAAWAKHP